MYIFGYNIKKCLFMAQTKMTIRMDTNIKQQAQELFARFRLNMNHRLRLAKRRG